MKKTKILAIILSIALLIPALMTGVGASANVPPAQREGNAIVDSAILLYTGYRGYSWNNKYNVFNDAELDALVRTSNEFILINFATYNWYIDDNGIPQEIVTMDDLFAIRPTRGGATWANGGADTSIRCNCAGTGPNWNLMLSVPWTASSATAASVLGHCEFLHNMWYYGRKIDHWMGNMPSMTLQDYVNDAVNYAVRIVQRAPTARLWIALPATEHLHILTHLYTDAWIEHIILGTRDELYRRGRADIWHNNIVGVYYGNEEIHSWFTPFDRNAHTNPDADYLNNTVVRGMRELSDFVRGELGLHFLWIPTVNLQGAGGIGGGDSLEIVGLIANRLNIFCAVLLQPNYYFRWQDDARQPRTRQQIPWIARWVQDQVITNPGNNQAQWESNLTQTRPAYGGGKVSTTEIGFLMEIDQNYFYHWQGQSAGFRQRWQAYVNAFQQFVGVRPSGVYAGAPYEVPVILHRIDNFFSHNRTEIQRTCLCPPCTCNIIDVLSFSQASDWRIIPQGGAPAVVQDTPTGIRAHVASTGGGTTGAWGHMALTFPNPIAVTAIQIRGTLSLSNPASSTRYGAFNLFITNAEGLANASVGPLLSGNREYHMGADVDITVPIPGGTTVIPGMTINLLANIAFDITEINLMTNDFTCTCCCTGTCDPCLCDSLSLSASITTPSNNPLTIQLLQNTTIINTITLNPGERNFTLENVQPGTYSVVITQAGSTSFTINNIIVTDSNVNLNTLSTQLTNITLTRGDVDGSGAINISDIAALLNAWGTSCIYADVDGSGTVNISDIAALLNNWGASNRVVNLGS